MLATAQATQSELQRMIDKNVAQEMEKEAAEERPLFDDDALEGEGQPEEESADGEKPADSEDVEKPSADIFKDFPEGEDDQEGKTKADDDEEPKVDPFANTELGD